MTETAKRRRKGYVLIIVAAMIYSTTEVALKSLGGVLAPMQITVERVLIAAAALMPFALRSLRQRGVKPDKSDWCYFALLGFLTVTLHMTLLQMAVVHMDASATAAIYSGNPVFAVAAAHFVLHEPLKKNHLLAIALEVVGIVLILNPAKIEISVRGFAEILGATVLFALYGTLCKLRMDKLGGLAISAFNLLVGGAELLAILLLGKIPAVAGVYRALGLELMAQVSLTSGLTLHSAVVLVYVGIFCAGFGFLLTAKVTEYTSATEASFIYLVKPILATALAVFVLGESVSVNRAAGIAFFVAASLTVAIPTMREMKRI